jgi:hypothetical protein
MTKGELVLILHDMLERVKADDSYGGFIEYDSLDDVPNGFDFFVRAGYRVGNLQGQGGMRVFGETE